MPQDHRIQPHHKSPREALHSGLRSAGTRVAEAKDLWPRPSDYAGLRGSWRRDLLAGLTVGVVALPLALGFGVASGAGAAAGLATAIIAGLVAAVFGGSHLQVSGPTGAMTVVLLPVIHTYGLGAVPTLALLAGIILVVLAVTGLGRTVDLLPFPVIEGFTMGIGVIIALQQVPLLLDADKATAESTLVSAWLTAVHADWTVAWRALAVAAFVMLVHVLGQRLAPKLPIALISIVLATVGVELLGLDVARIGNLPHSLPMPSLPTLSPQVVSALVTPAMAVAALAALESLLSARVADGMAPQLTRTNPDRELMGQGLANMAVGLFGGLPATGAIARTAVNVRTGGRTRLASVAHALVLLLIMVGLGPLVARIPMAALGGVLVMVASRMVSWKAYRRIAKATHADRNTFLITFGATVALDLVSAVLAGVGMAAVMSLRHMAAYTVVRRQQLPASTREGLVDLSAQDEDLRDRIAIYRVDGALFYGNAARFVDEVTAVEDVDVVIIRFHRTNVLDASGAQALKTAIRTLKRREIPVVVQGMTQAQVRTATVTGALDQDHQTRLLSEALARAVATCRASR
ncbi:SulP family sulfate permease [Luteococcus japonicus]|uniref:Sulfate permease n=2 Tax=Luteococcus japonicus TaxID=33984 RepID=A0A1R4K6H0_9ACTN|nr:SulP family inorganic anion transporter [Luteococcus japonicus]ROR53207.1 SulP family sulfate permease [Luteococcus japonicus]SJN39879.1 Sulfate permease [Luteococcus japonicus LSP_Lj1]